MLILLPGWWVGPFTGRLWGAAGEMLLYHSYVHLWLHLLALMESGRGTQRRVIYGLCLQGARSLLGEEKKERRLLVHSDKCWAKACPGRGQLLGEMCAGAG